MDKDGLQGFYEGEQTLNMKNLEIALNDITKHSQNILGKNLPAEQVEELCRQTDEIFKEEGMTCYLKQNRKQVFTDTEESGFMDIDCCDIYKGGKK